MKKFFYVGVFILFVVFGLTAYRQSEKAEIYRADRNQIHQPLIEMRGEVPSLKLQVIKLNPIIESERSRTKELVQEALRKK